ncbi:hypothetical protein [Clostridium niameyense]|uniref:hypothetical protein n=1 Tax=Clostridium niameyense TaxID=1622073 RepID=UPI00067EC358|nr:hypothetical protein [Clostridium niameyense]
MIKFNSGKKILIILTLVFGCISISCNINNFSKDINYIKFNVIKEKEKNINKNDVDGNIANLCYTIGEAIDYIKNNLYKEKSLEQVKILLNDSIVALSSIENSISGSNKNQYKELIIYIKSMRDNFIRLDESLQKDTDDRNKENHILNIIENDYKNVINLLK